MLPPRYSPPLTSTQLLDADEKAAADAAYDKYTVIDYAPLQAASYDWKLSSAQQQIIDEAAKVSCLSEA